jgi:twitching motility protein PilT
VSSPDEFTLPLRQDPAGSADDRASEKDETDEPRLPLVPPPAIPVTPPTSLPMTPPSAIPVTPVTPLPVEAPSAIPVAPPEPIRAMAPVQAPDGLPMREQPTTIGLARPAATARIADLEFAPEAPPTATDVGIVSLDRGAGRGGEPEIPLDEILLYLLEKGGSDLHLSVNSPPMIRVHGDVEPVPGYRALTPTQLQETVYAILTDKQKQRFEETKELDLAYQLPGAARFRVNLMQQQGSVSAVMRAIPWEILPLEALNMPRILGDFADLPRGLVLVTGPTGSGKSTTLAAVIDKANRTRKGHIVTIEDPIEFVHRHRQCIVNQREVGEDTLSFDNALKHALRQDPDIILVGEMRDLETIAIALTAAETGHLVFGTLHTSSAATTIDRIIDVFPPSQQAQIRTQLAASVQAVVCQTLCKRPDGKGRIAATEVMIATPAVRNLIREGKLQSIPSALQTGSRYGMHTLNQDLARLVQDGRITYDVAREKCSDASELNQLLGRSPDASD